MLAVLVLGGTEAQAAEENCTSSPDHVLNAHNQLVKDIFREMLTDSSRSN
jgi:hypothetical protein